MSVSGFYRNINRNIQLERKAIKKQETQIWKGKWAETYDNALGKASRVPLNPSVSWHSSSVLPPFLLLSHFMFSVSVQRSTVVLLNNTRRLQISQMESIPWLWSLLLSQRKGILLSSLNKLFHNLLQPFLFYFIYVVPFL